MIIVQSTPAFRRGVLIAALAILLLEAGVFVVLWRLGSFVDPGGDARAAAAILAMGLAVTLQAMAVVGVAWIAVAMAWTTMRLDDAVVLSLEHPWRQWQGTPHDVVYAWRERGWLTIELRGHWRRWYVRAGADTDAALAGLCDELPPGTWLEGRAVGRHLGRTVLPIVIAAAVAGGLLLFCGLRALDRLMQMP